MIEKSSKIRGSKGSRPRKHLEEYSEIHHHHYYYEPPRPRYRRSSKPGIAGALLILTAIIGIVVSGILIFSGMFVGNIDDGISFPGAEDTGDVTGKVRYMNGTPAENVTISIVGEDLVTQTDGEGNYVIFNVPTGNQKIQVEKDGYNTIIYKTFISPSESEWRSDRNDDGSWDHENKQDFTITTGDDTLNRGSYPPWGMIGGFIFVCAVLMIVFSIVALIGGYYAIKRRKFKFALLGAILGILTLVGALFSLIALFILIISRNEFDKKEHPE